MIDIREITQYCYSDEEIEITCTDGQRIVGKVDSIDEEEESGIDEIGVSLMTSEGLPMVIGISEIESIMHTDAVNLKKTVYV